jgi:hypothetical protein
MWQGGPIQANGPERAWNKSCSQARSEPQWAPLNTSFLHDAQGAMNKRGAMSLEGMP